jgi:repressor LexA
MPEVLTDLERRVLDYLVEYLRTNTYQPSIREIGRTFGIKSTKTVSELLQSLADKGWVERDPSRSRGVKLLGVELHTHSISVPMQHAMRSDALDDVDALELDRRIASRGTFLIVMPDEGLTSNGIQRGDMLLVEPVSIDVLDDGDVVLASMGAAQLVRRFTRSPVPRLESDDTRATPVVVGLNGAKIDGRVISVVRRLRAPTAAPPTAAT